MKVLLPYIILSLCLFFSFSDTGSIRMNWLQTYHFSTDGNMTYWSSIEMEGIQIAATYNTPVFVFKQSWAKGNVTDDYWSLYNVFLNKYFSAFLLRVNEIYNELGVTGLFTIQCWLGCTSTINDTGGFTYRLAGDGEEGLHLNLTAGVWQAEDNPLAKAIQAILQKDADIMDQIKNIVQVLCQRLAYLFSLTGKEAFSKKLQPEVYITKRPDESETEVICMVTGFYPKPINVSLWKENKMEDLLSTEILPNGDGTYQITVSISMGLIEEKSVYCQVEHVSLKEPIILYLDKKHHTSSGLVVGITIVTIVCVVGLACFVKHCEKHRSYSSITGVTMDRLSWRRTQGGVL